MDQVNKKNTTQLITAPRYYMLDMLLISITNSCFGTAANNNKYENTLAFDWASSLLTPEAMCHIPQIQILTMIKCVK